MVFCLGWSVFVDVTVSIQFGLFGFLLFLCDAAFGFGVNDVLWVFLDGGAVGDIAIILPTVFVLWKKKKDPQQPSVKHGNRQRHDVGWCQWLRETAAGGQVVDAGLSFLQHWNISVTMQSENTTKTNQHKKRGKEGKRKKTKMLARMMFSLLCSLRCSNSLGYDYEWEPENMKHSCLNGRGRTLDKRENAV